MLIYTAPIILLFIEVICSREPITEYRYQ